MLGNTLILSFVRNSIELIGFCILFLLLDKPRFSWKRTIFGHGLFLVAYIIASTVWILIDMYGFGKFVTLTIFVGAAILFPIMSSDSPAQTIYNISLQIFVLIRDIDLVAMLANLMENAIHGCIHSENAEPFIELYIGRKASKLVIYIKNTAGEDVIFENGIPISSS